MSIATPSAPRTAAYATDESRWAAVQQRDAAADGAFWYSVRTTGVYCRPGCPSRRPRRENVQFHASPAAAERAGYRPCRRCRPDTGGAGARQAEAIARACRLIEAAETPPPLERLAGEAGLSPWHFHRLFKSLTGVTPRAYAEARRARRMRDSLATATTVTEAAYAAGYNSSGRFYAATDGALGMTPGAFRAGGRGVAIRFAVGQCSLGAILVAATGKGVCAIALGDDPDALVRDLQERFPEAELLGGDPDFEHLVATAVGLVETPGRAVDLPLDVRGTAFQRRVWQVLREIPAGTTLTYTDVARRIGRPTAARAVATAIASNTLAVAIPCHRVVRTDGTLSGYRWGVARKRALLRREAAQAGTGVSDSG